MVEGKTYIYPKEAKARLKLAKDEGINVYIYAMTGYGKTELVEHYLKKNNKIYLDAESSRLEEFNIPINSSVKKFPVVIDNLQFAGDDEIKAAIVELLKRRDLWIILISRAVYPDYLMSYRLKGPGFVEIGQEQLALSLKEASDFFDSKEVSIDESNLKKLHELTRGHGMSLNIVATLINDGVAGSIGSLKIDDSFVVHVQRILWDYVETEVYNRWDPYVMDKIMRLCVVDYFDKELAEYITGSNQIERLLHDAMSVGNFITIKDSKYHIDIVVRQSMLRRLERDYDKEMCDELYYNAGLYYKQRNYLMDALRMFDLCGKSKQIGEILEDVGRSHPGNYYLYNLRNYYFTLDEEIIENSLDLMCGMSMLCSLTMNVEKSEYWYEKLKKVADTATGSLKKYSKSLVAYLDIALPYKGSKDMVSTISNVAALAMDRKIKLPDFCVTGNAPSNMNGGKDFCEWSRRDAELARSIGKAVSFVLGKHGSGLVDLALAESFFEKGGDDYEIIRNISKGLIKAEGGKIEQYFVGQGLLAKLHILKGNIEDASDVILSFKEKCINEGATHLMPEIENFLCQLDLYSGNSGKYFAWIKNKAPDENKDFFTMERYRYLTKIRIYIAQEKYMQAQSLIERMLYYAETYDRPYIRMECELLQAIMEYRIGVEAWRETLQRVYERAEDYHFVRVLTKEAGAALEVFDKADIKVKDNMYYEQVMEEMRSMAEFYPDYLKSCNADTSFTDNALQILKLQAQGLSNEQIADKLSISVSTVKYHCRENYQKLGAKNRVIAVAEARKRKLI